MNLDQIIRHFPIPSPMHILPLAGGANNRVYKLEFAHLSPLVLKEYFQDEQDLRPRLRTEFSFLQYAWSLGLRQIPKPLSISQPINAALYSFVDALPVSRVRIDEDLIDQTITFFQLLNEGKAEGIHLPNASEACFSIEEVLKNTETRILRLQRATDAGSDLHQFVHHELLPTWFEFKERCLPALERENRNTLTLANRCISPSDFGFHNALLQGNQLYFIDFEYAGWDDPCKTVSDFFCQPKIPIPKRYFRRILDAFAHCTKEPENFFERFEWIYPAIQMKWCCIILNGFTKIGRNRRRFSHSDEIHYLEKQLMLARKRLQQMTEVRHGVY